MALKKLAHVAELAPCKQSDEELDDLMSPSEAPDLMQQFKSKLLCYDSTPVT